MQEFLNMGGYAGYVWGAFGLTTVVLLLNVVLARRYHRQAAIRARRRHGSLS